jgi:hypothetical protein
VMVRILYDDDLKMGCPAGYFIVNREICSKCDKDCKIKKMFEG